MYSTVFYLIYYSFSLLFKIRTFFSVKGLVSSNRGSGLSKSLLKIKGIFRVYVGILQGCVEVCQN